jgi:hypothetical protein
MFSEKNPAYKFLLDLFSSKIKEEYPKITQEHQNEIKYNFSNEILVKSQISVVKETFKWIYNEKNKVNHKFCSQPEVTSIEFSLEKILDSNLGDPMFSITIPNFSLVLSKTLSNSYAFCQNEFSFVEENLKITIYDYFEFANTLYPVKNSKTSSSNPIGLIFPIIMTIF